MEILLSKFNGKIKVKKFLWQTSVWAGGFEQSGPLVKDVWRNAINNLTIKQCNNVLVLGLGCGTVAKLISKKFPHAKIVGVEIDPAMIGLGKKYFNLEKINNLKIHQGDAAKFNSKEKFDLILVDTYYGGRPVRLKINKNWLARGGLIIYNILDKKNLKNKLRFVLQ